MYNKELSIVNDYDYYVSCDDVVGYEHTTTWLVEEDQLEPFLDIPVLKDCLTDPNTDYEKITENPIYFEFVDIGKALNKLKAYEHCDTKQPDCPVTEQEKYALRYVLGFRESTKAHIFVGCIIGVSSDTVSIKFEDGTIKKLHRDNVYTTYTEALERYKRDFGTV